MKKMRSDRKISRTQDFGRGFGEVSSVVILTGVDKIGFHEKVR